MISEQWVTLGWRLFIREPNLVQKCWSTPKLLSKIEIQDGGRPPSWIFENLIFEQWVPLGWRFSIQVLYQIWCNNFDQRRNYGPKSKSKMAAVRHLGIDASSYRATHDVFSLGHISSLNFMQIRCIILKIWRFGLKYLFTPQKFRFLGVWTPKSDWSSSRSQEAHPWPEPRLHGDFGGDRSSGATWARAEETIKAKLGVRPDHQCWRSDMWSCMPGVLREVVLVSSFVTIGWTVWERGRISPFPIPIRPVAYRTACRSTTVQAVILLWPRPRRGGQGLNWGIPRDLRSPTSDLRSPTSDMRSPTSSLRSTTLFGRFY